MASSPGKWEVVGKGGKAKKPSQGNKKTKPKVNEVDLPKLDIKAPIPESKTQFDAFTKAQEPQFVIPKAETGSDSDSGGDLSPEILRQPDRRRKQQKEAPKLSLEELVNEALKQCDVPSVENFIIESREKYSNNQLVLLRSFTAFFQKYFEGMSLEKDPVLSEQAPGFPLCCVASDVQDLVVNELKKCDEDEVDKLFKYYLDELLIEINKGRATYGVRLLIQCLLKRYPLVTISDRNEHLKRVESRKNNPREALSSLWAFGQTSDHEDLVEGMTAWTSFMLPVIEVKHLSRYVIEYLERTLSIPPPKTLSDSLLNGRHFQRVLEITFGSTFQHFPFRRQLQLLYREIKAVAFAAHPKVPLTDLFSSLFDSLSNECGPEYQQEVLCCVVECLEKDASCHYKWRNNYLAHLRESSLLLRVLVEQWQSVCRSIPQKYLLETLREFQTANEELKDRDKPKAGLQECATSCNALLSVIAKNPVPNANKPSGFYRIFKLLLFILFAVVCVDIYRHKGYEGSKTIKILRRYGIERAMSTVYQNSKHYVQRLESWTEKRYPVYYNKVREVVEPASEYTITKLHEVFSYLVTLTAPARDYIHKTVPPLLEKFEEFFSVCFNRISTFLVSVWSAYSPVLKHYSQLAWDTLAIYVPLAWTRARNITWNTLQWIYNLSPDFFDAIADGFRHLVNEVVTRTPHLLELVQEYLLTAWRLVVSGFAAVILWLQENVLSGNAVGHRPQGES